MWWWLGPPATRVPGGGWGGPLRLQALPTDPALTGLRHPIKALDHPVADADSEQGFGGVGADFVLTRGSAEKKGGSSRSP